MSCSLLKVSFECKNCITRSSVKTACNQSSKGLPSMDLISGNACAHTLTLSYLTTAKRSTRVTWSMPRLCIRWCGWACFLGNSSDWWKVPWQMNMLLLDCLSTTMLHIWNHTVYKLKFEQRLCHHCEHFLSHLASYKWHSCVVHHLNAALLCQENLLILLIASQTWMMAKNISLHTSATMLLWQDDTGLIDKGTQYQQQINWTLRSWLREYRESIVSMSRHIHCKYELPKFLTLIVIIQVIMQAHLSLYCY